MHFDAIVLLAELPAWQRAIYPLVILRCEQMPNVPATWSELGKLCKTDPSHVRKAVSNFKRLHLLEVVRIRDKDGGDEGFAVRFPWGRGGQPVPTPGGQPVPIPGGQPVPIPGGQPVPTPFLTQEIPEENLERPPPPNPQAPATREPRVRAIARGSQGGGGWTREQLEDVLSRFPRTPERGGLVAKWLSGMQLPPDVELAELRQYFAESAKDPELVGNDARGNPKLKFPLWGACSPERFAKWRDARAARAARLAAPAVDVETALADELAAQRAAVPIGPRRRAIASGAASEPASNQREASNRAERVAPFDPLGALRAAVGSEIGDSRRAKRSSRA